MRMRQFTPHQPSADIRITPQEYKTHPGLSLKHDDLYARAWQYDYGQPIFDAENNNATPPNSPENPVQPDLSTDEMWNTLGTAHECSPKKIPQTEDLCDVTNTYSDMEPDVETISDQPNSRPINPCSSE